MNIEQVLLLLAVASIGAGWLAARVAHWLDQPAARRGQRR